MGRMAASDGSQVVENGTRMILAFAVVATLVTMVVYLNAPDQGTMAVLVGVIVATVLVGAGAYIARLMD